MFYIEDYKELIIGQEYLFINVSGDYVGKPFKGSGVYAMLRRLERKTGIKASPHMLRHYFANARRKDGWKLEMISQALGHGEDAWLKVYQIKMKADKMIPIPLVMYRIMRKYIEREHIRPKDYIFKGKDGGAYRGTTFRQEFQQYCDKNGIADGSYIFKTHDYRHTLATQFYDEDVSIQTIRDYLGHFSEEMTKQYVDFMPKRIEKASDTYFKKQENDLASTIKAKKRGERI